MNATSLMVWGLVVHLVCDWLLQNEWMALNKMKRRQRMGPWSEKEDYEVRRSTSTRWYDRHPAAYVHAGIHTLGMLLVFDPLPAIVIGAAHFLIDLRWPVEKWSKVIRQTQPGGLVSQYVKKTRTVGVSTWGYGAGTTDTWKTAPVFDIGTDVRIWTDQVFHIAVIAIAALVVV